MQRRDADADVGADPEPTPSQTLVPQRYRVQFTANQEYVDLLETAKDLLAHAVPSRSIEEVHLRAMRALVAELKKRKTGATRQPRRKEKVSSSEECSAESAGEDTVRRRIRASAARTRPANQRGANASAAPAPARAIRVPRGPSSSLEARRRTLHLCRCDWANAVAKPVVSSSITSILTRAADRRRWRNLRLRCRAHNALTAEQEFGRDFMAGAHRGGSAGGAAHVARHRLSKLAEHDGRRVEAPARRHLHDVGRAQISGRPSLAECIAGAVNSAA